MSATSVPSRLGSLFNRNGNTPVQQLMNCLLGWRSRRRRQASRQSRRRGRAVPRLRSRSSSRPKSPEPPGAATPKKRNCAFCDSSMPPGARTGRRDPAAGRHLLLHTARLPEAAGKRASRTRRPTGQASRHYRTAEDKARIAELEAQIRQLTQRLPQAEIVIDVQKKLSRAFGHQSAADRTDPSGEQPDELLERASELVRQVGPTLACRALSISRATFYRRRAFLESRHLDAAEEPLRQTSAQECPCARSRGGAKGAGSALFRSFCRGRAGRDRRNTLR